MYVRTLTIDQSWEFIPEVFPDSRGVNLFPFHKDSFEQAVGYPWTVAQMNHSTNRVGALRGVHWSRVVFRDGKEIHPGQAKYVYCPVGEILDIVVDFRVGSPTFGLSEAVVLTGKKGNALFIGEGLGHALVALTEGAVMTYLCSTVYNPEQEFNLNPFDKELALAWPVDMDFILSDRDRSGLSFMEAAEQGVLPQYSDCLTKYSCNTHSGK